MIKYILKQNKNSKSSAYGKYYAYPVVEETINLADLARHMEEHSTGFSEAMCMGVLTAMVKCIKEQLLAGKNVKIDNLAIFSCGIRNSEGAATIEDFSVANNIAGLKLRARATGNLSNTNISLAASIRKATTVKGSTSTGSGNDGGDNGGAGGTGGNDTPGTSTGTEQVTISVTASPTNGGSVTGGGTVAKGSQITLNATANSGYTFYRWSDGVTTAQRSVTANASATYTAEFNANAPSGGNSDD